MSTQGSAREEAWIVGLLERHEPALLRYAQRIVGDAERARDVVQDTFLKLTRESPESLDGHATEWLFAVCRNRALDVRRKERRMAVLGGPDLPVEPSRERGPADAAEIEESTAQVFVWLEALPPNQREVIRLKFQGGLSYRGIADATGHSVSNVGFLIHTGMKTLRQRMRRAEADVPRMVPPNGETRPANGGPADTSRPLHHAPVESTGPVHRGEGMGDDHVS